MLRAGYANASVLNPCAQHTIKAIEQKLQNIDGSSSTAKLLCDFLQQSNQQQIVDRP